MKNINEIIKKSDIAKSFRLDNVYFKMILADALFCVSAIFIALIYLACSAWINYSINKYIFQNMTDSQIVGVLKGESAELARELIAAKPGSIIYTFFIVLLAALAFLVLFIAVFSFFNGIMWLKILRNDGNFGKNKLFKKTYFGLFRLNLVWFAMWIAFALFFTFGFKPVPGGILLIFEIILCAYFSLWLYSNFNENSGIFCLMKSSFVAARNIHLFIIPFIFVFVFANLFIIIVFSLVSLAQVPVVKIAGWAIGVFLLFAFVAWVRRYFYIIISRVKAQL